MAATTAAAAAANQSPPRPRDILFAFLKAFFLWLVFYGLLVAPTFTRLSTTPQQDDGLALLQQDQLIANVTTSGVAVVNNTTATNDEKPVTNALLAEEEEDEEDYEDDGEEDEEETVTTNETTIQEERQPRVIEEEIVLVHLPDPFEDEREEIEWLLEDLQNAIDQLRAGLYQSIEDRLHLVVEESLRNLLEQRIDIPSSTDLETPVPVQALEELLSVESLSTLSEDELEDKFWRAREELQWIMEYNYTVPWNQVEAVLNKVYPRAKTNTTLDGACPKPVLSDLNQSLARDTDLAREVSDVQRWVQALSQDLLHASVLRTRHRHWEQSIAQLAAQAKTERNAVLAQDIQAKNQGQNCITQEQVLEMVDEGLYVLQQQPSNVQALRAVLERKTKALEPEAQVILDAIFLPSKQQHVTTTRRSSWLASTLTTSSHMNLRQVLDTPLFSQQVPLWVDGFEKWIGGHLDVVDDFLDWLVQQPPPPSMSAISGSSKITVGHVVVARLLGLAGKVNVTIPSFLRKLPRHRR